MSIPYDQTTDTALLTLAGENVWASLPVPLCDWFLLVPQYLTIPEFVRLSSVSKRYREVFGLHDNPKSTSDDDDDNNNMKNNSPAKRILASLLPRDAICHSFSTENYEVSDQLPTIGNWSVEESVAQDPLAVAKLRKYALRRRRLVLIKKKDNKAPVASGYTEESQGLDRTPWNLDLDTLMESFAALPQDQILQMFRRTPELPVAIPQGATMVARTKFVCVNQSGVELYCHWIEPGGSLRIEEGDKIMRNNTMDMSVEMAAAAAFRPATSSFVALTEPDKLVPPQHIFIHNTCSSHAFAICYEKGGPPFAIYQCRRSWTTQRGRFKHVHAIAVLPKGKIKELHCDACLTSHTLLSFDIKDRANGIATPAVSGTFPREVEDVSESLANRLAEKYYGVNVPNPLERAGLDVWQRGRDAVEQFMGGSDDLLNHLSFACEAYYLNLDE